MERKEVKCVSVENINMGNVEEERECRERKRKRSVCRMTKVGGGVEDEEAEEKIIYWPIEKTKQWQHVSSL